jgi:membrane-associated phospholipid phosphatase
MKAKRFFLATALLVLSGVSALAGNWYDMEPLKLEVPEMKAELATAIHQPLNYYDQSVMPLLRTTPEPKMDFDFFKSKTNPGVKEYKFMDDMTFVGVPLFLAGIAIKGDKAGFQSSDRYANSKTKLVTNFKTSIDDYTQMFGPAMTVGLKLAGVEGRSDWPRLVTSSLISYAWMAAFVNGIKYTAKEMRPDGSTANSWPSGHTATSFVGATILHKEYGLTRSPWYSVAGYGVATATGVMRILNNRHWISDVMSGAGIGILSAELGYAVSDLIFKKKGLLRNDREEFSDNPSFFSISMGLGWGLKNLSFSYSDTEYAEDVDPSLEGERFNVDFHTSSVVDAEGAYFFNKYIGVGGRLRVRAMTAKSWSNFVEDAKAERQEMGKEILDLVDNASLIPTSQLQSEMANMTTLEEYSIESDHLTEFSANVGLYFNLPLSERFALGSKLLIGRSMTQALDINAHYQGDVKNMAYTMEINDGFQPGNGLDEGKDIENDVNVFVANFASAGKTYDVEWDYLTLSGNNSTNFGTGLSLTYKYKSNFSWKIFVDYDYSKKEFTFTADPYRFLKHATPTFCNIFEIMGAPLNPISFKKKKDVHFFTIGGSFAVTF